MAEGDTILRAARRLQSALVGQRLEVGAPSPRGRAAGVLALDGQRLERVESRGKNLLLRFERNVLHSHLGMHGSWRVVARGAPWRRPASTAWVVLRGEREEAVQFGGPSLRVLTATRLRADPRLARLGPDILAPGFDAADVAERIRAAGPDRALGDALIDQRLVAGVGNIFKSEGAFRARVDPWRPVGELAPAEVARVLAETRELMLEAVESGRQPRAVYRRAGQPCPRCGTPLASRGQGDANRTTFWCPRCQDPQRL